MGDLYPTKTRLQLLADVANSQVLTDILADDKDIILLFPDAPVSWFDRRKVTARVRELQAAGWVREEELSADWRPTDAGWAILAEHGGSRG